MEKAVIDRIVDGKTAVVLVGDSETEYNIGVDQLPSGAREGSHLLVEVIENELARMELDNDSTSSAQDRINKKMELLRQKSKKQ